VVIKNEPAKQRRFNTTLILSVLVVLVLAGTAFWYLLLREAPATDTGVLTPEAKAYTRYLALADVAMSAHDSFMQSTLVEITGNITNSGDRTLRLVEINCVFYDPYMQVVLRERVPIVRAKGPGLKPGQSRSFRLPFDALPANWNQAMPQLVIARIDFED
jgi:hypothetical protein